MVTEIGIDSLLEELDYDLDMLREILNDIITDDSFPRDDAKDKIRRIIAKFSENVKGEGISDVELAIIGAIILGDTIKFLLTPPISVVPKNTKPGKVIPFPTRDNGEMPDGT